MGIYKVRRTLTGNSRTVRSISDKKLKKQSFVKRILGRIMHQSHGAIRSPEDVFSALRGEEYNNYTGAFSKNRDLINLYLYGDDTNFEELTSEEKENGVNYDSYIRNTLGLAPHQIKQYKGRFGKPIILPADMEDDINTLLSYDNKYKPTFSLESSYIDDDVAGYLIRFGKDKNGNIVANNSDIYDFYKKDYTNKWLNEDGHISLKLPLSNITTRIGLDFLNRNGRPFILRDKTPVIFDKFISKYDAVDNQNLPEDEGIFFNSLNSRLGILPDVTVTPEGNYIEDERYKHLNKKKSLETVE